MEKILKQNQLASFAAQIIDKIKGGDCILLRGDLGAGKTALTKEIAKKLGLEENITSPTFVIMKIYPLKIEKKGINKIVHIDAYRLNMDSPIDDIMEQILDKHTLSLVEWPENINLKIKNKKEISIQYIDSQTRKFNYNI